MLLEPGPAEPDARFPPDRLAGEIAAPDIECPVNQHLECEPGPGAELEHAHAALVAVPQRDQPHPGDLLQPANAAEQLPLREFIVP